MDVDFSALMSKVNARSMPEPNTGCTLWMGAATPHGYGVIGAGGRKGKSLYVHRIAYEAAVGPIPEGAFILHSCDNPACCNPEHLRCGSTQDNTADMVSKDRHCRGERSKFAKLTAEAVVAIRRDGRSLSRIAADYGVDIKQIHRIKRRENWKHVA